MAKNRIIQYPQRLIRNLRTILDPHISQSRVTRNRPGNVVMFHIGRSGSTVLGNLLHQCPEVLWDKEIYERVFNRLEKNGTAPAAQNISVDPVKLLCQRMVRAEKRMYGFEVKFYHLRLIDMKLADYIQRLDNIGICKFIILERKNYLRKIVSSLIAQKSTRYHQKKGEKAMLTRIRLDVDKIQVDRDAKPLLAYLQDYQENFHALTKLLEDRKVLRLTYEDDVSVDPLVGHQRICDFLGLDYHQVSIRYGKVNPFKLSDMIINFEEVERTLGGSQFEWMPYQ